MKNIIAAVLLVMLSACATEQATEADVESASEELIVGTCSPTKYILEPWLQANFGHGLPFGGCYHNMATNPDTYAYDTDFTCPGNVNPNYVGTYIVRLDTVEAGVCSANSIWPVKKVLYYSAIQHVLNYNTVDPTDTTWKVRWKLRCEVGPLYTYDSETRGMCKITNTYY